MVTNIDNSPYWMGVSIVVAMRMVMIPISAVASLAAVTSRKSRLAAKIS